MTKINYLTQSQREHFVEHGSLKISNAIRSDVFKSWTEDLWVRLGWDAKDKSTWGEEYLKMPRHREMPVQEMAPEAWKAMCELVGGEENIDPVRERYHGDQFIINFGREHWETHESPPPKDLHGWHHDNDWYRQFLDSSGNALTIIHCFSDIPPRGGGTSLCDDGLTGSARLMLDHPEGFDPPDHEKVVYKHIKDCKKFTQVEAKAGDTFIVHGMLPHTHGTNHLHYARIITNPQVNMVEPFDLNRPDGDYTPCQQAILRALGRESIPEYKVTRERKVYYPRTATFKTARVQKKLKRMLKQAEAHRLSPDSVDSVYLKGEEEIKAHFKRNGYDRPHGPAPLALRMRD